MDNNKNKLKENSLFISSLCVFIISMAIGIIFYNRLPDEMAVHFNSNFVPDNYAPKWFALFGITLLLLFIHCITIFIMNKDPKQAGHSKAIKLIIYMLIPILSIVVEIELISFSLNKAFNISTCTFLLIGIVIMLLGNYLPKTRQNYTIGFKLPWTLSSEKNWNKTHKLAGKLWVSGGILISLLSILIKNSMISMILIILIITIIPTIYSYYLYSKSNK